MFAYTGEVTRLLVGLNDMGNNNKKLPNIAI
jgi:hypothetical protein